ncbi:MAG: FAD:protein FMN transferase [Planctomycetota bacterium]
MHTTFEVIIVGETAEYAEQAAWAAFDLLDRLEQELSRFIHVSDVSRINALQPGEAIRLGEAAFECLEIAMQVWRESGGAFDVTLGPPPAPSRKGRGKQQPPTSRKGRGNALGGMERLELFKDECAVLLKGRSVSVDFGGIGKGYAVDKMVELLKEWSVSAALVHGGESSIYGLSAPPGSGGWKVTAANPKRPAQALRTVLLRDRSLSASSIVGDPHILDPRTGKPVKGRLGAWSLARTAALADALSTAFMVMPAAGILAYCRQHPECAALCATQRRGRVEVQEWNWPRD